MPRFDINKGMNRDSKQKNILFEITRKCNLNCKYCYENKSERSDEVMSFEFVRDIIEKYLSNNEKYDSVLFSMFGGEPLLEFPLIKKSFEYAQSKKWNNDFLFHISTNGTILTDEMKEWFYKNRDKMKVGLSFDGSKIAHDAGRDHSYDMVFKNLPFFKNTWPEQPVKCTICADTIHYTAESVIAMENLELFFSANIPFEDIWGDEESKKKYLEIYEDQLAILVDYYTDRLDLFPPAKILNYLLEYINFDEEPIKKIDRYCGAGKEMIMYDVQGKSFPCHRFSDWITGYDSSSDEFQSADVPWGPEKCSECKLLSLCPTCAGYNYEVNKNGKVRTTFHCEFFKLELLASAKLTLNRILKKYNDVTSLPMEVKSILKRRLNALHHFMEVGI